LLVFEPASLRGIVEEAASLALEGGLSAALRPTIEIDVDGGLVIDVARARLVQALTNVLTNALQALGDGASAPPIQVRSVVQNDIITIAIQDFGCGMSRETQEDATTLFATSKPNGTGFGLPLAVKIVESEHKGRLELESAEGRGTIVRITMPTVREHEGL